MILVTAPILGQSRNLPAMHPCRVEGLLLLRAASQIIRLGRLERDRRQHRRYMLMFSEPSKMEIQSLISSYAWNFLVCYTNKGITNDC